MMNNRSNRVSILERLAPSIAFAVAAISGAVGSLMLYRFLSSLREAAVAGYFAFFTGISQIELVVGGVLLFAATLGAIGILVSIIRLFTTNQTSSPPGFLFLIIGLLSIVPPFAIHYLLHEMKEVVLSPDAAATGGIGAIAGMIMSLTYFTIGSAFVMLLVLIAFTFIPFSSRPGRKASPLICLMIVEVLIAALAGIYFWEARGSITQRDKSQKAEEFVQSSSEILDPQNYNGDRGIVSHPPYNTIDPTVDSDPGSRAISGGVLNDKAIELPQPAYPVAARAVRASGTVTVQVLVDKTGKVVSATAVSGHPLLRAAAVQAARNAKFKPTMLSGQPVKVTGVITYNFVLQ